MSSNEWLQTSANVEGVRTKAGGKTSEKVHRVGTVTLGLTLVGFGAAYMLRLFLPKIPLMLILHFWPAVMIVLGVEVLLAGFGRRDFVIDKVSVVLLFLLVGFIFCMAGAEWVMRYYMLR